MSMTKATTNYPVADALIRLKNASAVYKQKTLVRKSKFILEILRVLKENNFIKDYKELADRPYEVLVYLNYKPGNPPVPKIEHVKFFSKPGRRWYVRVSDLKPVRSGYGIQIITTPKGVMTTQEAKKQNVGGELICEIW